MKELLTEQRKPAGLSRRVSLSIYSRGTLGARDWLIKCRHIDEKTVNARRARTGLRRLDLLGWRLILCIGRRISLPAVALQENDANLVSIDPTLVRSGGRQARARTTARRIPSGGALRSNLQPSAWHRHPRHLPTCSLAAKYCQWPSSARGGPAQTRPDVPVCTLSSALRCNKYPPACPPAGLFTCYSRGALGGFPRLPNDIGRTV
jgi:hypothetical protein